MKKLILALMLTIGFASVAQQKEMKTVTVKSTAGGIPMKKDKIVVVDKPQPVVVKKVHHHRHHGHREVIVKKTVVK